MPNRYIDFKKWCTGESSLTKRVSFFFFFIILKHNIYVQ